MLAWAPALSVHGALITAGLTIVVMALTWALVGTDTDPRGILGWVLGAITAGAGLTLLLHW